MSATLGDLAWPDLSHDGAGLVLIVPIGSTEQHGPHLPFSTDTDIAVGIAERVADTRHATLVAPPVTYGSSGEHEAFAGTISIGSEAMATLIVELVRSASASFARIVLLSAHGGNGEPVALAVRQMTAEGRNVLAWSPRWDGDAHAGRTETSIMLALRPELVRVDDAAAGNVAPLGELWPALRDGQLAVVSPNGVLGDPAGASSDEGRSLLGAAVEDLTSVIDRWVDQ